MIIDLEEIFSPHSPASYLSQKLQRVLAQFHTNGNTPLPVGTTQRPGPAKPKHGIPPAEWPTVLEQNIHFSRLECKRGRCSTSLATSFFVL